MLTGDRKSIMELLHGGKYSLVNNQREYVWSLGGGQIDDFLTDIKYYSERRQDKWFLGQVVLLRKENNGVEEFKIIDGQQRLTTICLFLAACRDKAKNLANSDQQATMQRYISFVNGTDGRVEGLRVSPSKSIRDIFDKICANPEFDYVKPDNIPVEQWRKQQKIIKNIFEEFKRFIADKDQISLTNTIATLLDAYIFRLISEDAAETYALFENTNAKGTPLEATDLLKNLLMEEIGDTDAMEADWNDIANNSGTTGVRMLKYFYTSKYGTLERGNIYRKVRDNLVRRRAEGFVKEYREFSLFYRTLEEDISIQSLGEMLNYVFGCDSILQHEQSMVRIYHAIQGIQLLGIILCYPMLYSLINAYMRNEKTEATRRAFVRIFESIERFHFVNTRICDSRANRVETLYAEYCEKFNNCNNDFVGLINNLINKMKNEYTMEEEIFVANFKDLEYGENNQRRNTILYYIFDRFNNYNEEDDRIVDPAAWTDYYSPGRNIRRHLFSIEHYAPRTPSDGVAIENVHNIGNLFIIGTELNGRLSNLSPREKMVKLKGELYPDIGNNKALKEFVDEFDDNWDEESVDARATNLARRAYNKIWNLL
ncbi:MAG: DUF262 domain-containing protein [Candidatus Omnitrophota bacterium]